MGLSAVACAMPGISAGSATGPRWRPRPGLVSVHFVNAAGSVLVAPFGGVERRFSTAPYCVGIPRPGAEPLILDFATSIVAEGKVLVASRGGKKLPDNALVGPDGRESADPHMLYGDYQTGGGRDYRAGLGAIRAFGEHKGSGLAFICELLGGALTGHRRHPGGSPLRQRHAVDLHRPQTHRCRRRVRRRGRALHGIRQERQTDRGGSEILLPGEPEERARRDRMQNGVPLSEDAFAAIIGAAREIGVPKAAIGRRAKAP